MSRAEAVLSSTLLRHREASRCPFHKYTASYPGFSLGAPRSSVASGAGLEPGAPRGGHWCRTYEMDIQCVENLLLGALTDQA